MIFSASCTTNYTIVMSVGEAEDVVDDTTTPTTDVKAEIPINP